MDGMVEAVHRSASHTLTKPEQSSIRLLAGLGVEGDAHMGVTVKHRSRVARDPSQPNLRQVHLIHAELHDELRAGGFSVRAGEMGENITTRGVDLLHLPVGARLHLGAEAVVEITGLRNPCAPAQPPAARSAGSGAGPRRAGPADPQGGYHGHRAVRRRSAAGRSHTRGVAAGTAPATRAGLSRVAWSIDGKTTRAQPLLA